MNVEQAVTGAVRVTVVIPAWGRYVSTSLGRAVRSAKAASRQPVRVVVVDNAHEHAIVVSGAEMLRSATRLSLGEARNFGLAAVGSEWVLFLDADDRLLPGSIDGLLAVAEQVRSCHGRPPAVVTAPLAEPGSAGLYHWPARWMRRLSRWPHMFRLLETVRAAFPVTGALIRTEVAADGPGFDGDPAAAEDWVFGVSLAWRGRVVFAPEPAMTYTPAVAGRWSQHREPASQRAHRVCVRRRFVHEPAVPRWARSALPALWIAHQLDGLRVWRQHRRTRVGAAT